MVYEEKCFYKNDIFLSLKSLLPIVELINFEEEEKKKRRLIASSLLVHSIQAVFRSYAVRTRVVRNTQKLLNMKRLDIKSNKSLFWCTSFDCAEL